MNVKSNGTASTMKPFLQRKTSNDQKSICTATVNQEKVGTSSPDEDMPMNIPPPPATDVATSSGKSVSQFFSRNDVLKSEVLWTLKTISSHCSYNSNGNIDKIFRVMFPDSQIAAKFTCGSRKTSYLCVFGLATHFKEMLMKAVKWVTWRSMKGPWKIILVLEKSLKSPWKKISIFCANPVLS